MATLRPYKVIDLFSGAGGLTAGFKAAFGKRMKTVWANDSDGDAVATYNLNFGPYCVLGDIVALLDNPHIIIPQADLVLGGPPCQGFSLLNKNRENDPRKELWRPFLEVVKRSGARAFLIENVPQLLNSPEHEAITEAAEKMGFRMSPGVKLCAADYGVSQTRHRAFLLGSRVGDPTHFFPPQNTHYNSSAKQYKLFGAGEKGLEPWRTVRDAIADLPEPIGVEITKDRSPLNLHFGRTPTPLSLQRYKTIPGEGMNRFDLQRLAPELTPPCWIKKESGGTDLFGRLWWDRPAFTIRTEFFKPEKGRYLHPSQHRPITHREAARLQSFEDEFEFVGSKISVARQIGNAVPPLLAAALARSVLQLLDSAEAIHNMNGFGSVDLHLSSPKVSCLP